MEQKEFSYFFKLCANRALCIKLWGEDRGLECGSNGYDVDAREVFSRVLLTLNAPR